MKKRRELILIVALISVAGLAAGATKKGWDFEKDHPGKVALGFRNEVGQWEVAKDGDNHVLCQRAKNDDDTFNIALIPESSATNVDLSVRVRAIAGEIDRGGGLVWRAKDAKNYYVARYNPLEDNFRVFKVRNGKRSMLKGVKVPGDEKWHMLRVTMVGPRITGYFDGAKCFEVEDATFPGPGMTGLWSKADAQSYFDDLTVSDRAE